MLFLAGNLTVQKHFFFINLIQTVIIVFFCLKLNVANVARIYLYLKLFIHSIYLLPKNIPFSFDVSFHLK